jgi:hypothetical protein
MIYRDPWHRSRFLARRCFRVNSHSFFPAILAICFAWVVITSKQQRWRWPVVASVNCGAFRTADLMLLPASSNNPIMRSILGIAVALCVAAAFGLAYWLSARPGASWLDGQWLFLVALPYNWASLHVLGDANFSPDKTASVAAAFVFDVASAFLAGALVEALSRWLWRITFRRRSRA